MNSKYLKIAVIGGVLFLLTTKVFAMRKGKISKNFTLAELVRTSTGLRNVPGAKEVNNLISLTRNVLQPIRDLFGKAVIVSSGFRSKAVNKFVGGVLNSKHMFGRAADFTVLGVPTWDVFIRIANSNIPYSKMIYEKKGNTEWIHIEWSEGKPKRENLTAIYNYGTGRFEYTKYV